MGLDTTNMLMIPKSTPPSIQLTHPFNSLSVCAEAVTRWFLDNGLLINPSKTEAVVFGTRQQVTKIDKSAGISFAGSQIKLNDSLKVLGVKLDSALTMNAHVNEVV